MTDTKNESQTAAGSTANPTPVVTGTTNTIPASVKTGKTDRLGKPWAITDKLLTFLAVWESGVLNGKNWQKQMVTNGFILTVYNDSKNLPTVGCGHLVVAADNLKVGDQITLVKAQELLKKDLKITEDAVNRRVNVPLYQYEYDALVSITYNVGTGDGMKKLVELVNTGKYETIPDEITKYRAGGGHEKRREQEANIFKSDVYDATH